MLRQRCPWCGEQLPLFIPFKYLPHSVKERIFKCPTCKKEYKIYQKHNKGNGTKRKWLDLFVLLFFIVFFVLLKVRWIYYPWWLYVVISLSVFAILFLYEASFTYMRSIDAFFSEGNPAKSRQAVCITWEPHRSGGLLCPRLQVQNGQIFPACFSSWIGAPVSSEVFVMLENLDWTSKRTCRCDISVVLDHIPTEPLFREENTFVLYYNGKKIAKGVLE